MPSYPWLSVFQRAQEENDFSQLHARVMEAEGAMLERGQQLRNGQGEGPEAQAELQELRNAIRGLLRIKTERLKWPAFSGRK
jgi:hypothetical protein